MANTELFTKVYKYLYGTGMSAMEILIVSQIIEFQEKGLPCFITDNQLAKNLGTSERTISRTIGDLEKREIVTRDTQLINGKRTRVLKAYTDKLSARESRHTDKLSESDKLSLSTQTICLEGVRQNVLIIDNIRDNRNDKKSPPDPNCRLEEVTWEWIKEHNAQYTIIEQITSDKAIIETALGKRLMAVKEKTPLLIQQQKQESYVDKISR